MAQPSHVPKFGNWENDNIPYTTYFENARKDKVPGTKIFNPNDPEENPDDFVSGIFPSAFELKNADSKFGGQELNPKSPGNNKHNEGVDTEFTTKTKKRYSGNSGFSADKSSSDNSDRRQSKYSDDESFQVQPQKHPVLTPVRDPRRDAMHDTPSSVPKFGIWDERDPTSGDGFTVIFNKVKQEKHIAATRLPKIPSASSTTSPSEHQNREKPSSMSKILCCCHPTVKE